jgi:hypothetical protein
MPKAPNSNQYAPGYEVSAAPIDEPYRGADPSGHVGVATLMDEFKQGAVYGYYGQFYDPHVG